MKHFEKKLSGVCSTKISFDLDEENAVHNVAFVNGCNGNLKAVSKLTEGMPAKKVIALLKGNTCGGNRTSCADQYAKALEAVLAEE